MVAMIPSLGTPVDITAVSVSPDSSRDELLECVEPSRSRFQVFSIRCFHHFEVLAPDRFLDTVMFKMMKECATTMPLAISCQLRRGNRIDGRLLALHVCIKSAVHESILTCSIS